MHRLIKITDTAYPKLLKEIKEAPESLYIKGGKDDLTEGSFENCVAIVGSRKATKYGKDVVQKVVPTLVTAGMTIVSGFMFGIDIETHKSALEYGGKTIAVMPCGIDYVHPFQFRKVYEQIVAKGGLVTRN